MISILSYPAWVISYWAEVLLLVELKKRWAATELFLLKHRGTVPCSGDINGFISGGAMEMLITYLSQAHDAVVADAD
ncbi:hypothetical protein BDQ17DRAFT_1438301 [Cyathus striatus]|nr:hypothetical protein BDQ17DRAFT_1438301 [Cyathus striatus]